MPTGTVDEDGDQQHRMIDHFYLVVGSYGKSFLLTFPNDVYSHSHENGRKCSLCQVKEDTHYLPQSLDIAHRDMNDKTIGDGRFANILWEQVMGMYLCHYKNFDQLMLGSICIHGRVGDRGQRSTRCNNILMCGDD